MALLIHILFTKDPMIPKCTFEKNRLQNLYYNPQVLNFLKNPFLH